MTGPTTVHALLMASFLVLVAGCADVQSNHGDGTPQSSQPSPTSPAGTPVEARTLAQAYRMQSCWDEETTITRAFTQESEWAAFWAKHTCNHQPAPDLPPVDFSQETVLAVVDETRPAGGYEAEIESVVRDGSIMATYVLTMPDSSCPGPAVLTQPSHIVAVKATGLPVDWHRIERTRSC